VEARFVFADDGSGWSRAGSRKGDVHSGTKIAGQCDSETRRRGLRKGSGMDERRDLRGLFVSESRHQIRVSEAVDEAVDTHFKSDQVVEGCSAVGSFNLVY
jgi:hypothetical protein